MGKRSPSPSAVPIRRLAPTVWISCFGFLLLAAFAPFGAASEQQEATQAKRENQPATAAPPSADPPAIVIGFVGGLIRHDDPVHDEVRLAARLRKAYPSGVDVETFESYRGENARKKILSLLDTNHDGTLSPQEKQNARIILYGHSWGAAETIGVARELEKDGVPILLTVQIDSVSRPSQKDEVIPTNVARAANFYQPDGLIHGVSAIRAADPARTKIIGNFRFEYKDRPYTCYDYPWYDRILVKTHTQIECDPVVWRQVEALIRSELPSTPPTAQ
jgi:hypothetical protein